MPSDDLIAGPSAPPVEKKTPIKRPRKACTICRRLKTRCLPDGEHHDPTARCSRCARLGLDCIYSRARRGRPPRVPNQQPPVLNNHHRTQNHTHPLNHPLSAASASGGMMWDLRGSVPVPPQPPSLPPSLPPSADSGGTTNGLMPTHPSIDMLPSSWGSVTGPDGQPIIQTSPPGLYEASTGSMDTTSPNLAGNLPPTRSSSRLYDIKQSPNLHNYLEPTFGAGDESQHRTVPFGPQDQIYLGPIDTGLLSEAEARLLFNQFFQNLSPSGGYLFDTQLHTFERMRACPPVFTAILATAARFFRPDLKNQLTLLNESLVMRALLSGDHNIELIQALMVMIYWRRQPDDRTMYVKLGMACRLLSELHIEWPQGPIHLAQTEEEQRRRVDRERTFYNVVAMDLWYSMILHLPPNGVHFLPTHQQTAYWADQYRHLDVSGDYYKSFVAGVWEIQKDMGGSHFTLEEAVQFDAWTYNMKEKRLIDHLNAWLNSHRLRGPLVGQAQILGKVTLLRLRVIGLLQNVDPKITGSSILSFIEEIITIVARLAHNAELIYWVDVSWSLLPMPGILLHNARRHIAPEEYGRAMAACSQMRDIFFRLGNLNSGGDDTMMGISRFYGRLGKAFDRVKMESDDPQVQNTINNIVDAVPRWSPLLNVNPELALVNNGLAPTDWTWVGAQPQWDGAS